MYTKRRQNIFYKVISAQRKSISLRNGFSLSGDDFVKDTLSPFWKGVYSEKKEVAPLGVDPIP